MLKEILQKTELNFEKDTHKSAFLKGMVEGALDGLVILGAIQLLANVFDKNK